MDDTTGEYCSLTDIQNVFGLSNVTLWSNLDNTSTTTDTTRIAAALAYADDEIDNFFRGGPYAVPLILNSGCAPTTWAAKLAGIWLYDSRGQLDTLMDGKTVLVVAHRLLTIAHLDRILVFDNGCIVEDGPHRELLARDGVYARLWSRQSDGMIPEHDDAAA